MRDYDEEVAKMPRRRKTTAQEIQQWRYGSEIDRRRHASRQSAIRYVKWVVSAVPVAAALSSILKAWWHG